MALWYTSICDVHALLDSTMHDLFVKMQNHDHCLYQLLPLNEAQRIQWENVGITLNCMSMFIKQSFVLFVVNCLF